MNRRNFILGLSGTVAALSLSTSATALDLNMLTGKSTKPDPDTFPFQLTDEEWRARLSKEEYHILRSEGTEKSCSSPLNGIEGQGDFYCKGCGHHLFSTASKFDSGTGWPSFYEPVDEHAIGTSTDYKIGAARTETHCANCGSHLGHVFPDGPPPTGLRYCINGLALEYVQNG